jgi:hypothetical protein
MKRKTKIILALIIGFVFAMVVMTIAIYFGYVSAYKHMQDMVTVKALGIPIYELKKRGTDYTGISKGMFMGLFCGIFMVLAVAIEIIVEKIKKK